jgi:hypothetical protein
MNIPFVAKCFMKLRIPSYNLACAYGSMPQSYDDVRLPLSVVM